jgi:hypothetical protein
MVLAVGSLWHSRATWLQQLKPGLENATMGTDIASKRMTTMRGVKGRKR